MSNQIQKVRFINGLGEEITLTEGDEYFDAARVSFGSLGIITEITLKMRKAYKLKVSSFPEDMETCLGLIPKRLKENRHLEMFYFPVGDWSIVKLMNETNEEISKNGMLSKFNDLVLENWLYELLNISAKLSGQYAAIDKLMRKFVSHQNKTNWSHLAFPTDRNVKFMEMEFNLPIEKFEEVFSEIKSIIKAQGFKTLFPIEIRYVKSDPIWLSPAYQRDSVYFAVHTYISEDWQPYFEALQEVFKKHGGRPHWGKWHSLKYDDLKNLYPRWKDYEAFRMRHDPNGIFLNHHLKEILLNK